MKLDELKDESNYQTAQQKRQRGYAFERYLFDSFESQGLKVKRPYKKDGEQIDGGIYLEGTWYLIEAKWHAVPLPVSEVYSFRGKVDGKFTGTCGFFISWSGYSKECADALSLGKELKVLLCDSTDVERAAAAGWKDVFLDKLMYASLYGLVYAPDTTRISIAEQENEVHQVEVFVEGASDVKIIESFLRQLDISNYVVIPGGGKVNAIHLASSLAKPANTRRILILDSDGNSEQDDQLRNLPQVDETISIEPEIESLFFPDSDDPRKEFHKAGLRSASMQTIDLLTAGVLAKNPQNFVERLKTALSRLNKCS